MEQSSIQPLEPSQYQRIVFFTGAGISAESGIPTYRGKGGIWRKYNWEEYASQKAFNAHPEKVLKFHEKRRRQVRQCVPNRGHEVIAALEHQHPSVHVVTQNIDGLHQQAGSEHVIELHGNIWYLRCEREGILYEDHGRRYKRRKCKCGAWLRPHITWFGDYMDSAVTTAAEELISQADLFISIGTSGVVWPASMYPQIAQSAQAYCVEVNPEPTTQSHLFHVCYRQQAGVVLPQLFPDIIPRELTIVKNQNEK